MRVLKAKYIEYRKLSCLEVITRFKINYYKITPAALKENSTRMTSAYNVNQPFKIVIVQIKMSVNFYDSG